MQDPFGTDTVSCYVRFTTADPVTVSYIVAAFSRTPRGGDVPATEHEFKVIGLIPSHKTR